MGLFRGRNRLWMFSGAALVLLLVIFVILLSSQIVQTAALYQERQQPRYERPIPFTDVNPFGANFFLDREVEPWKIDKTLQMAADAGIGWVKQQFPWAEIEPLRKGEYLDPQTKEETWAKYDRIVEACERYGLEIVARLDRPPDWARADNTYKQAPPDDFNDYGDFVYTFVSRYKGRIRYIQIWNEPNIFPEWGNKPVDPVAYTELLKIAYRRAKEADPNIVVLSAPLAPTLGEPHPEPGKWRSMSDLAFLEAMYQAGAADYFDIFSTNAFGMDQPPTAPPSPDALNFQRVLLQRRIMERYGDGKKPVWFNEYGWNAAPEDMSPEKLIWKRVSEQEQARYTVEGIRLAHEEWPWAGVFFIWYFRHVGDITPDQPEYYFRMVDTDFTPRLIYLAVQDVAKTQGVAGIGRYQHTNPAVSIYGHWRQVLAPHALAGSWIESETPGDSVTLTFRGQNVDLLTHCGPTGGRLAISLDGQPISGLPTDAKGLTYVSLYCPNEKNASVPLVRHTGPGKHTLRLIVADSKDAASQGYNVVIDAFEVGLREKPLYAFWPIPALLIGIGLDIWLLTRLWKRIRWTLPPLRLR